MMRLSLQEKVAGAFAVALIALVGIGLLAYRNMQWVARGTARLEKTYTVLRVIETIQTAAADAETGSRGYIITGDPRYLEPYAEARATVAGLVDSLRLLTADNPRLQADARRLDPFVDRKLALVDEAIERRRRGDYAGAAELVRSGRGLATMDSIHRITDRIEAKETAILRARAARARQNLRATEAIVASGILLAVVFSVAAIVLVRHDARARVRSTAMLARARDAAEAASQAKSDFLARMSHELRTPLNLVIGFANVLRRDADGRLSDDELRYLDHIRAGGEELLALVNDLLDISRIEAGRVETVIAPVAVDEVVRDTLERFAVAVRDRPVALRGDAPPGLEPVASDPVLLRQVLQNLIGNALKFTRRGAVTVRVRTDPVGARPVRIDVVDTGIGIAPERQHAVFQPFEQGDGGTAREFGGTGLGLAVAQMLCERMGHRLALASEPGVGSVFSILLAPDAPAPTMNEL